MQVDGRDLWPSTVGAHRRRFHGRPLRDLLIARPPDVGAEAFFGLALVAELEGAQFAVGKSQPFDVVVAQGSAVESRYGDKSRCRGLGEGTRRPVLAGLMRVGREGACLAAQAFGGV